MTNKERDKLLLQLRAESLVLNNSVAFLFCATLPPSVVDSYVEALDIPPPDEWGPEVAEFPEILSKTSLRRRDDPTRFVSLYPT